MEKENQKMMEQYNKENHKVLKEAMAAVEKLNLDARLKNLEARIASTGR